LTEALNYCRVRGDCMFIGAVPDNLKYDAAKKWVKDNKLQAEKVYGAVYFPFILVSDPIGTQRWIPRRVTSWASMPGRIASEGSGRRPLATRQSSTTPSTSDSRSTMSNTRIS